MIETNFEQFFKSTMTNENGDTLTIAEFEKKLNDCEKRIETTNNAVNKILLEGDMKDSYTKQKFLTWSWRFWKQCTIRNILKGNNSRALKSYEMYQSNLLDARLHNLKIKQENARQTV